MRLDNYILQCGLVSSRNKAKELITSAKVKVDGKLITKPSFDVENAQIEILQDIIFVSRAGDKLNEYLKEVEIDIEDKFCLDIGSSTGGFVEVLLHKGAREVVGVDVGSEQLHPSLRANPKVISVENTNIKDYQSDKKFDIVTCDVSFIGVESILKDIDRFARNKIIILFKPQFEVGKDVKRDKRGVVKDKKAIEYAQKRFESQTFAMGWNLVDKRVSKIKGKEGNVEIFYYFTK